MHFFCNETTLNLFRDKYLFFNPEEGDLPVSGDWILEVYYNFDNPDGWGSVGGEFIHWKDIVEWLQGMKEVEQGKLRCFEKTFYQSNAKHYFLKLILETVDDKLRLQLSISDGLTDEYINIDQLFSKEEWKIYSDEFRTWNEIFPFRLGDHVHVKEKNGRKAGKIGIVKEILVKDYLGYYDYSGYSVSYGVASLEEGWNGPYWNGFVCNPDEIELIERNKLS